MNTSDKAPALPTHEYTGFVDVPSPGVQLLYDNATHLSIATIHRANQLRQVEWDEDKTLGLLFHSNALGGETGEFQNIVKKLERRRLGLKGSEGDLDKLADEAADVLTYLELACAHVGIDLGKAFIRKFNYVSEKHGLKTHI